MTQALTDCHVLEAAKLYNSILKERDRAIEERDRARAECDRVVQAQIKLRISLSDTEDQRNALDDLRCLWTDFSVRIDSILAQQNGKA